MIDTAGLSPNRRLILPSSSWSRASDKVVTFAQHLDADGTTTCVLVDMFRIKEGRLAEYRHVAQRVTTLPFR